MLEMKLKGHHQFSRGFQLSGYQNRLSNRAALIALTLVDLSVVCGEKEEAQGACRLSLISVRRANRKQLHLSKELNIC